MFIVHVCILLCVEQIKSYHITSYQYHSDHHPLSVSPPSYHIKMNILDVTEERTSPEGKTPLCKLPYVIFSCLTDVGNAMLKESRPVGRLFFNMELAIHTCLKLHGRGVMTGIIISIKPDHRA